MTEIRRFIKQKGVALVVGLLLLLVSSFMALAAFQSGMFQERMASNQYNKAMAFMAAEQGGSAFIGALGAGLDIAKWNESPLAAWQTNSGGVSYYRVANVTSAGTSGNVWDATIEGVSRRSANDPENLAQSQLNIRIQRIIPGGGSAAAINLVGPLGKFEVPNSNALKVFGAFDDEKAECKVSPPPNSCYGPAIAVLDKDDAEAIEKGLKDKDRLDNYKGGIGEREFDDTMFRRTEDFTTGDLIGAESFGTDGTLADLKYFVDSVCQAAGPRCGPTVPDDTVTKGNPFDERTPQLTVVQGDAPLTFQGSDKGAGVLVVTGDLITKGTPSWDGIILVLGGTFNIVGGGTGGVDGTIYVLDTDTSAWTSSQAEAVSFLSTAPPPEDAEDGKAGGGKADDSGVTAGGGGGNASFIHNCGRVQSSLKMVTDRMTWLTETARNQLLAKWFDEFGCGGVTGPGTGPATYTVLLWVETLN